MWAKARRSWCGPRGTRWYTTPGSPSCPAGTTAPESCCRRCEAAASGSVDLLVLSHADLDHVGGASAVLRGVRVRSVLAGEPVRRNRRETVSGRCGLELGRCGFLHHQPLAGAITGAGNNASCVLLVETPETRVLLAGDIEAAVERRLVLSAASMSSSFLITAVATSSTDGFVAATRPRFAVVGAGFDNHFGHPNPGGARAIS